MSGLQPLSIGLIHFEFKVVGFNLSAEPGLTPHFAASYLVLHFWPISNKGTISLYNLNIFSYPLNLTFALCCTIGQYPVKGQSAYII